MTDKADLPVSLNEVWEDYHSYTPVSDSVVDGNYILAKVTGPAFFPDSKSGNNVFYPRKIWDQILDDPTVHSRLESRTMYGTIGHDIVIDDNTLREGVASHVTTRMWIDEDTGIGMAEYLILNTKVGRILNTLLRAGSKLRVSTKAKGLFSPRKRSDGARELVKYLFERIDFVITPGFEGALPEVTESLNAEDRDLLTALINESNQNGSDDRSNEASKMTDKTIELLEKQLGKAQEQNTELRATNESLQTELAAYKELGTPSEIEESLDAANDKIDELAQANAQVNESFTQVQTELNETKSKLDSVNESLSAQPDHSERLAMLDAYEALGTPEQIGILMDIQEELAEIGTVEEIKQLVEANEAEVTAQFNAKIAEMAEAAKVDEAAVRVLADTCGNNLQEVSEMLRIEDKLVEKQTKQVNESKRLSTKGLRGVVLREVEAVNENKQSRFNSSGLASKLMTTAK